MRQHTWWGRGCGAALSGRLNDPVNQAIIRSCRNRHHTHSDPLVTLPADGSKVKIIRGPNIKPLPVKEPLTTGVDRAVKTGDHVTTDQITAGAAHAAALEYPAIAEYVFHPLDQSFCAWPAGGRWPDPGVKTTGRVPAANMRPCTFTWVLKQSWPNRLPGFTAPTWLISHSALVFSNPEQHNRIKQEDRLGFAMLKSSSKDEIIVINEIP